jgi:hypothetical protein
MVCATSATVRNRTSDKPGFCEPEAMAHRTLLHGTLLGFPTEELTSVR